MFKDPENPIRRYIPIKYNYGKDIICLWKKGGVDDYTTITKDSLFEGKMRDLATSRQETVEGIIALACFKEVGGFGKLFPVIKFLLMKNHVSELQVSL